MLILDAGNSRIKWGWWQDGAIVRSGGCELADELPSPRELGFSARPPGLRVVAVSVARQEVRARLTRVIADRWGAELEYLVPAARFRSLQCAYADPRSLGVDRWAGVVAAYAGYGLPAVVVDCGTAVTVDYVDGQGLHQGGVIFPGLGTLRRSLHTGTALLPEVAGPAEGLLGVDTAAAIRNGTFQALVGGIDHIVATLAELRPEPGAVHLLTGGDAAMLAGHLRAPFILDTNLVLTGAALLAADS